MYIPKNCLVSAADINAIKGQQDAAAIETRIGRCLGDTNIIFNKAENSNLNLTGKSKG